MKKLKYKELLYFDKYCIIKYKNKVFKSIDEMKRYLYKHPANVNHYTIRIYNKNAKNPFNSSSESFDYFKTLDNIEFHKFMSKHSYFRTVHISKNLDEIYGETTHLRDHDNERSAEYITSFDFAYICGDTDLGNNDIVECKPYSDSGYEWDAYGYEENINIYKNLGRVAPIEGSLFLDVLYISPGTGKLENAWYNDLSFYPSSLMTKVMDNKVANEFRKLLAENYFNPAPDFDGFPMRENENERNDKEKKSPQPTSISFSISI